MLHDNIELAKTSSYVQNSALLEVIFWGTHREPHSKWHVESANGLMDLMFLADNIYRLTA